VEVAPNEPDAAVWGENFPAQYERYQRTMKTSELETYSAYGRYGGSEAFSRLDKYPNLQRLFAGYSFAVEYNEDRGHLHAVEDVLAIKRLGDQKPGTCMTCKSSQVPGIMEKIGPEAFYATLMKELVAQYKIEHSISCADCHEAATMALRVSRPAFAEAMAGRGVELAKASHQEMRSYVCGQCHTEYYFRGEGNYLVFPWVAGFTVDEEEAYYDELKFKDWVHTETGAELVKVQHPEFELWSTGIHARGGVACPDCHMPYRREGAMKITDHWIRTPLADPVNACTTCHRESAEEMRSRVLEIQDRTYELLTRAEAALVAAQDEIVAAGAAGVPAAELADARAFHRRAFLRYDFISAENSMGFHSPQEAARILGDAIDFARRAELAAVRARLPR
jgi:nitrite reductase (cytochrome c-552)